MLKARTDEPEVIQAVVQGDTGHRDTQAMHVREVRQPEATGMVHLTKDDITLLAVHSSPCAYAPLKRTARGKSGLAPEHLLQYRHGPYAWSRLQQRNDLRVKYLGQGIRASAPTRHLFCDGKRMSCSSR